MAVNLKEPGNLLPVSGITLATADAQIRYQNRDDLVLIALPEGASVAGVFTLNRFCAAPVTVAKQHLQSGATRALLINAGNANAGTGASGLENAYASCTMLASEMGINKEQVLPFSTGVIGEQLPMDKIQAGVSGLSANLNENSWLPAAKAIMTTDTVAKGASVQFEIDGELVTVTGIAKGSGMICPDMATMLSYVATDANVSTEVLQKILENANEQSFNRITVDGDTSTNDACILVASNQLSHEQITDVACEAAIALAQAVEEVMVNLATAIIRDGEGATKFVKVAVQGGVTVSDCSQVAYTVAHSPLVKTALFASDPNWGRILAAVGRAPAADLDIDKVSISINEVSLIENGQPAPNYTEAQGQAVFDLQDITISIDLGLGDSRYHVWTSDLSHDYVSINADYRS